MWAHGTSLSLSPPSLSFVGAEKRIDLEKQQHLFRTGELKPVLVYTSKNRQVPKSDLPGEFVGGFPIKSD